MAGGVGSPVAECVARRMVWVATVGRAVELFETERAARSWLSSAGSDAEPEPRVLWGEPGASGR